MLPKEPAARAPATATASAGMELRSLAARVASGELPRAEYIGVCVVFLHTHLLARHRRNPARPVMLAAPASGMVYAFAVSMMCVQRTLSSH